jgi:hypothetical protein
MVIHITPISGALDSLPVPKPPPKTLGNVEVVLLSGETLALPICQGALAPPLWLGSLDLNGSGAPNMATW